MSQRHSLSSFAVACRITVSSGYQRVRKTLPSLLIASLIASTYMSVSAQTSQSATGTTAAPTTAGTTTAGTTTAGPTTAAPTTANPTTGTTADPAGAPATTTGTPATPPVTTAAPTTANPTTGTTADPAGAPATTTGTPAGTPATPPVTTAAPAGTPPATVPTQVPQATGVTAPTAAPLAAANGKAAVPRVFGFEFFAEARRAVDIRRTQQVVIPEINPLQKGASPTDLTRSNTPLSVPDRYQLGPGDELTLRISSPVQAAQTYTVKVSGTGGVLIPATNSSVILRGQTLAQATQLVTREVRQYLRDATVDMQLTALRTITIRMLGEVYAPGTYELPSVITVFNALYAAGGPADSGSLRAIELRRASGGSRRIDLYDMFIRGTANADIPLQPGDIIYVPPSVNRVTVAGEVRRPAVYELLSGEGLRDAVQFAGGAKPTGVTQRVSVDSVKVGVSRQLLDANLLSKKQGDNPRLYDGDTVEIFSIRNQITNFVEITGAVDQPRQFSFRAGMRVSDLIQYARGTLPGAELSRADLFRLNKDGSRVLIPINLRNAIAKKPADDVALVPEDRLVVYQISDVRYLNPRKVTARGALQRPNEFTRADGMTIRDLLIQAGGLLPTANDKVAILQRTNPDGMPGPILTIDLSAAIKNDRSQNVVLKDDDVLTVNTRKEAEYSADQVVDIIGAVQRPGQFTLAESMRLSDLLAVAGGLLPTADIRKAFLQRLNANGTSGPLVTIDLSKTMSGDETMNPVLMPKDRVTIFTYKETAYSPEEAVDIAGAVQRPGKFALAFGMTLNDLLALAGGLLPTADPSQVFVQRFNSNGTPGQLKVLDVNKMMKGEASQNLVLAPQDRVTVNTFKDTTFVPDQSIEISGAVQRPGRLLLSEGMTLSDAIALAGGLLPTADKSVIFVQRVNPNGTQGPLQILSLDKMMQGDASQNITLTVRDKITINTISESKFTQLEVFGLSGAFFKPGQYPLSAGMKLRDAIVLAGGVLPTAGETLEVSHAFSPIGTPIDRVLLIQVMADDPSANMLLKPGDSVTLAARSDIREKPKIVVLTGAVKYPGPYALTGANDRISTLISRAGGLSGKAFPEGTEFSRDPKYLATVKQVGLQPRLVETLRQVAELDYKRANTIADVDRLRIVYGQGQIGTASLPGLASTAPAITSSVYVGSAMDQAIAKAISSEATSRPRALGQSDILPNGNLDVNLSQALVTPGSSKDVVLEDGDIINIPERPTTVSISGAVMLPSAVLFEPGQSFQYYIDRAGGVTADAATDNVLIIRASGALIRYKKGIRIEVGDNILIPTKVMSIRLVEQANALNQFTSIASSAAITIALIRSLTR